MPRNLVRVTPARTFTSSFWKWTSQPRPSWRENRKEAAIIFIVFGITGSSSLYFVRPSLKLLGVQGSFYEGPNSYRILSILLVFPVYATLLMFIGTAAGRHAFFLKWVWRYWEDSFHLHSFGVSRARLESKIFRVQLVKRQDRRVLGKEFPDDHRCIFCYFLILVVKWLLSKVDFLEEESLCFV